MAVLRAIQFGAGTISGTSVIDIYTVPTGKKAILKFITLQEISGSGCVVNVRTSATTTWLAVTLNAYSGAGSAYQNRVWVVLEPGQKMQLQRTNAGQVTYSLNGSLMTI